MLERLYEIMTCEQTFRQFGKISKQANTSLLYFCTQKQRTLGEGCGKTAFSIWLAYYLDKSLLITFWLYIYFYLAMKAGMHANEKPDKDLSSKICKEIENLWENFKDSPEFTDDTLYLAKDCCRQAVKMYEDLYLFRCILQKKL